MKESKKLLSGTIFEEELEVSLTDICYRFNVSTDEIVEMVDEGILDPSQKQQNLWLFNAQALRRLQIALRIQRDLQVNLAGVALALDLLDEINHLRTQILIR